MKVWTVISIIATTALVVVLGCSDKSTRSDSGGEVSDASEYQNAMRKLWEEHITWTRLYIVSAVSELPDVGPTAARLLENQSDIGDAIKPYYGDAAGNQLRDLLRGHILIAVDLIAAAKSGNQTATTTASSRWYVNADSIAAFLNTANPGNWDLAHTEDMMEEHLDLTLEEAVNRLQGNYVAEIETYDRIHTQILDMADMLSSGIIDQFPSRF